MTDDHKTTSVEQLNAKCTPMASHPLAPRHSSWSVASTGGFGQLCCARGRRREASRGGSPKKLYLKCSGRRYTYMPFFAIFAAFWPLVSAASCFFRFFAVLAVL